MIRDKARSFREQAVHYFEALSYRERTMLHKTRALILILFVTFGLALAGCSDAGDDGGGDAGAAPPASTSASPEGAGAAEDDVTVLVPGAPGDDASTAAPGEVEVPAPPTPNEADLEFLAMMVPHHAQAVEMAELADKHATSRPVRALADRIRAAQGPEIVLMSSLLEEAGSQEHGGDHEGHDMGEEMEGMEGMGEMDMAGMPGMLTDAQLAELARARGRAFDRLFLQRMIQHHEGALSMAGTVAVDGVDLRVSELAADITLGQTAEIDRMRELLG